MTAERDAYNCSAKFITRDAGYGPVNRFMQLCEELSGFQLSGIYAEIRIDHPHDAAICRRWASNPVIRPQPSVFEPIHLSGFKRGPRFVVSLVCTLPDSRPQSRLAVCTQVLCFWARFNETISIIYLWKLCFLR
jgi:hypothetical protein